MDFCQNSPIASLDMSQFSTATALAQEIPIAISVNGISHAVMMLTPIDLEYFTIGFTFSEGIIDHCSDLREITITPHAVEIPQGEHHFQLPSYKVEVEISPRQFTRYKKHHSFRQGLTGCGLCGTAALDTAIPHLRSLTPCPVPHQQLHNLPNKLLSQQTLKGVHAALLLSPDGEIMTCHEDIGRHNALDKTLGFALKHAIPLTGYSVVMSSRCSVELIQKAVKAGLSTLIHMSSPSLLATQMAHHYHLNLIQITRQGELKTFPYSPHDELKDFIDE
ncbi:MAG: FdhD protein [Neptuniibacter pectenicola]|jgi:FdhD protein